MIIQDSINGDLIQCSSVLGAAELIMVLLRHAGREAGHRCWAVAEPARDGNAVVEWWLGVAHGGRECLAVAMACGSVKDICNLQTVVGARLWQDAETVFDRLVDFADGERGETAPPSAERET